MNDLNHFERLLRGDRVHKDETMNPNGVFVVQDGVLVLYRGDLSLSGHKQTADLTCPAVSMMSHSNSTPW